MNKNDYIIRLERKEEYRDVENLVRESFWNVYRPGCQEHYILKQLRDDPAFVHELAFVMEKDGKLIGQNIFVRAMIKTDDGCDHPLIKQRRSAAVRCALKAISIFTARADLPTRVHTASGITDCRREQMLRSFSVRN